MLWRDPYSKVSENLVLQVHGPDNGFSAINVRVLSGLSVSQPDMVDSFTVSLHSLNGFWKW